MESTLFPESNYHFLWCKFSLKYVQIIAYFKSLIEVLLCQYGKSPSTTPEVLPHWCAELSALLSRVRAVMHSTWLAYRKKMLTFFSNFPNFLDIFCLFGNFLDILGLVSPVTYAKIPFCATRPWCAEFGASHIMPDVPRNPRCTLLHQTYSA